MKSLMVVILSLMVIGSVVLYEGQKNKIRMDDNAKSIKEEIQMFADRQSMKEELLKHVPIGSSIQDANRIMEGNGFRCATYNNSSFLEKGDDPNNDPLGKKDIDHYNVDFLLCHKEGTPIQMVSSEWKVIIVHKNDVVSDIYVNIFVTGP